MLRRSGCVLLVGVMLASATGVAPARAGVPVPAGGVIDLQIGGVKGVPVDASAVVLNVAVTESQVPGFVTVWPCGQARPGTASLNYDAGETTSNLVIADLGASGKVCLFSLAGAHLVADVNGFFPAGADYSPIANPERVLDSRVGSGAPVGKVPAEGVVELLVGGLKGVPVDASAVALNVAVADPSRPGFVTVWPCGQPRPVTANLNYAQGETTSNLVIARLGAGRKVCLFSLAATFLIGDVSGFFPASADYSPIANPTRVLDSRDGTGVSPGVVPAGGVVELQIGGLKGVPSDALAVALNVAVTESSVPGFVTVWPCGQPRPVTANLNYDAGETTSNLVIAKLGAGGKVCLFSLADTHLVADVNGFFPAGADYSPIANPARVLDTRDGTDACPPTLVSDGESFQAACLLTTLATERSTS
jgi:hypothetical protein